MEREEIYLLLIKTMCLSLELLFLSFHSLLGIQSLYAVAYLFIVIKNSISNTSNIPMQVSGPGNVLIVQSDALTTVAQNKYQKISQISLNTVTLITQTEKWVWWEYDLCLNISFLGIPEKPLMKPEYNSKQ